MKTGVQNLFLFQWLTASVCLMATAVATAQTFTNLHSFDINDGNEPFGTLLLSGDTLYGTTDKGGSVGWGTVFAINSDGSGFRTLHSFNDTDGNAPQSGLILAGDTLYGTTFAGGGPGAGTLFAINTNGLGFTNFHDFTALNNGTNIDGASPNGSLIVSGNTLYGTTWTSSTLPARP